ncbi:MAG: MFS transporter [Spirochaetaceae bacterium]|nr:MAG: MFS transporter [Spirochaetaceae bacterium]
MREASKAAAAAARTGVRPGELDRSMKLSIMSGAAGTLWMIACTPQPIFNVFVRNYMGASSATLGIMVGMLSVASVFQVFAVPIYARLRRRKTFWIITSAIHRTNGFFLAAVAFAVAAGGSRELGMRIIITAMVVSWIVTNTSSAGWWSWMADLIPIKVRAAFFGRRSSVANVVNIAWFFLVTVLLDSFAGDAIFVVYGVVFLIGGIGGLVDILLHTAIPEPEHAVVDALDAEMPTANFFDPLRDRNFVVFCVAVGLALFSINVSGPFIAPYITSPDTIGAPITWLGIIFVISQMTWIIIAPAWGTIMDRFGRKPVVMMGLLFTFTWLGYLVITPQNYFIVLPIIALTGGILAPGFWDGVNQMMLSLTPDRNRLTYVAWYWIVIGLISAGGSMLGGRLDDALRGVRIPVTSMFAIGGFQIVILTSLGLVCLSLFALSRITEGEVKSVGFVFARVTNPGIFRTFMNLGILTRTSDSGRVASALRSIDDSTGDLAIEEILDRVRDPDGDVREEAVRALGRLRSLAAFDALIQEIGDAGSSTRVAAARALGRIGDQRAIPALIDAFETGSEELKEACITALGEIGGDDSIRKILDLFHDSPTDRVFAGSVSAASRLGVFEAAWEIIPRLRSTENDILRKQLAIAFGNIIGNPGEFYRFVTGSITQTRARTVRLFVDAQKNVVAALGRSAGSSNDAHDRRTIVRDLASVKGFFDAGEFDAAARPLVDAGRRFVACRLKPGLDRDLYLEHAYLLDPRLGIFYWLIEEIERRSDTEKGAPALPFEILLAVYFLAIHKRNERPAEA